MKFLILVLCFCLAVAEESILDDLDEILSSIPENSDDTTTKDDLLEKLKEALSEDGHESIFEQDTPSENIEPKYGYCLDHKTHADGPSQKGCARKMCYDATVGGCNKYFKNLSVKEIKQKCRKNHNIYLYYKERCPYTCGFCKERSPTKDCQSTYGKAARFGCCWDGMPALTPTKKDCMACVDSYPHTCRQFYNDMKGVKCGTNSYRIRHFLQMRCPRLCGRCT